MLSRFSNKKLLIFDFDGTIADTSPIHKKAFEDALASSGITFDLDYSLVAGMKTKDAFLEISSEKLHKERVMKDLDKLVSLKQKLSSNAIRNHSKPFHGVTDFIEWAKKKNLKLSIASSGSKSNIYHFLSKYKLIDSFDLIYTSEDCKESKPNPEIFLNILNNLKLSQQDAFIFEDSNAGELAAKNAGIDYAIVSSKYWRELKIQL